MPTPRIAAVILASTILVPMQAPTPASQLSGRWRGTSICIKAAWNRACHDETIVYDVTAVGTRPDSVVLHAYKIVADSLDWMGDLTLGYDAGRRLWVADFANTRVHVRWSYAVKGSTLTGKVVNLASGLKARDVVAKREERAP